MSGERDVHPTRKTAVTQEKLTASVLSQRRGHRSRRAHQSRRDSTESHETSHRWLARSAGHRPSGTRRLARLGWSGSGLVALALLAAACTGGGYSSSGTDPYGAAPATSSGPQSGAVVDLRGSTLGQTLVDGQGRTLYLFEADKAGKSECNGGCTSVWPPYLGTGSPQAGTGVTGALLGTSTRGDGGTQVTYHGHPLYHYAGDNQPGDAMGQGLNQFGARWFVLAPSGSKIDTQ